MAVFEDTLWLPCAPSSLYEFLLRPANVSRISDPRLGLNMVSAPDVVSVGSRIVFQVQGFGIVQTLEHEIIAVEAPRLIIEEQVKGPMKAWRHEHHFEAEETGVRMVDRVIFEPPGGVLGFLVKESKILESLEEGFLHREEELRRLAEQGAF
ncbi:MAG: SRPBCC family protein [Planctomyces sp.]|nr:SRPBCC family protein [Planctomyces sp.]